MPVRIMVAPMTMPLLAALRPVFDRPTRDPSREATGVVWSW